MTQTKASIISPEIKEILSSPEKKERLCKFFDDMHPHDIYILAQGLTPGEIAEIVMALGMPKGIEFFQEFKIRRQRQIFRQFPKEWMADVLEEMAPDERATVQGQKPRVCDIKLAA